MHPVEQLLRDLDALDARVDDVWTAAHRVAESAAAVREWLERTFGDVKPADSVASEELAAAWDRWRGTWEGAGPDDEESNAWKMDRTVESAADLGHPPSPGRMLHLHGYVRHDLALVITAANAILRDHRDEIPGAECVERVLVAASRSYSEAEATPVGLLDQEQRSSRVVELGSHAFVLWQVLRASVMLALEEGDG